MKKKSCKNPVLLNRQKKKSSWRKMEELVGWIEQHISPNSIVELDQHLPDLNSTSGSKRQCDIVIRQGPNHRQTITIVEVQKRKKPVDINTFDGWCQKMRDVGAQHLICVSENPFPKSIVDKALRIGPTIRLIHFNCQNKSIWPEEFSNLSLNSNLRLLKITGFHANIKNNSSIRDGSKIELSGQTSVVYNGKETTLSEIVYRYIDSRGITSDACSIQLPEKNKTMIWDVDGVQFEVISCELNILVQRIREKLDYVCSGYYQIDYKNSIAWVMKAETLPNDIGKQYCEILLIPDEEGNYYIADTKHQIEPFDDNRLVKGSILFDLK